MWTVCIAVNVRQGRALATSELICPILLAPTKDLVKPIETTAKLAARLRQYITDSEFVFIRKNV